MPKKVLIADDTEFFRTALKDILVGAGYNVVGEAANGAEALEMAARLKPDLVILDVVMPGKNVKEVYDEIKKIRPDIKALFMSGYSENVVHKRGILREGVNYITKPASPSELQEKMRELLDS